MHKYIYLILLIILLGGSNFVHGQYYPELLSYKDVVINGLEPYPQPKLCGSKEELNENNQCVCKADECCGVKLNTIVPFIGDCIEFGDGAAAGTNSTRVTSLNAFPLLMGGLMKILMTAILIFSFLMIIVAGFLMVTGGIKQVDQYQKGIKLLTKVITSLILLGAIGLILRLINPNFFG